MARRRSGVYDDPREAAVYRREDLRAGDTFEGPAIVRESMATTVVPDGATAKTGVFGELCVLEPTERSSAGNAAPDPRLLRELGVEEFRELYACDRFTTSVLRSRFDYVIDHVCSQLLRTAFSPIIRDFNDFSATLSAGPQPPTTHFRQLLKPSLCFTDRCATPLPTRWRSLVSTHSSLVIS